VIPTLNEARNVAECSRGCRLASTVVLVDGGSDDGTVAVARQILPDITVVQQTRGGKECSDADSRRHGDIIVMMDADAPRVRRNSGSLGHPSSRERISPRFQVRPWRWQHDIIGFAGPEQGLNLLSTRCPHEIHDLCYGYNAFWPCLPIQWITATTGITDARISVAICSRSRR